jgi:hypothetical protein
VFVASNETMSDNFAERENHSSFDIYVNGMFAIGGSLIRAVPWGAASLSLAGLECEGRKREVATS